MEKLKVKPKTVIGGVGAWEDSMLFKIYDLAKSGLRDTPIARAIGVQKITFRRWTESRPLVALALALAREGRASGAGAETFEEYVFKRLPERLQEVWRMLKKYEKETNGAKRMEALLNSEGKQARQRLFMHALVHSSFNASEACRKVMIPYTTLTTWKNTDPDFAKLVDEIEWHKGNFFEESLVNLVRGGDTAAVVFANKTFNRQLGYGGDQAITVTHEHKTNNVITIEFLDTLPLEVRKQILEAWVAHKKKMEGVGPMVVVQPEAIDE